MTSLRSSVRPSSSKQPWGTILEPEFGMGHQKMTQYEVAQTVQRLYCVPEVREPPVIRCQQAELDAGGIQAMVRFDFHGQEAIPKNYIVFWAYYTSIHNAKSGQSVMNYCFTSAF
jgi:hypothetical protein